MKVKNENNNLTIYLEGRIDSNNAAQTERELLDALAGAPGAEVTLDAEKLEYISSAGLRVLLGAAQEMEDKGEMVIRNLTPPVKEVFDVTGFSNAFNFE